MFLIVLCVPLRLSDNKHGASIFTLAVLHVEFMLSVEHCDCSFGQVLAIMKWSPLWDYEHQPFIGMIKENIDIRSFCLCWCVDLHHDPMSGNALEELLFWTLLII
jgi:hypothetical protein